MMLLLGSLQLNTSVAMEAITVQTCAAQTSPYAAVYRKCDFTFFYLGGFTNANNLLPPGDVCDPGDYTIARHAHAYIAPQPGWSDACVAVQQRCYALHKLDDSNSEDYLYSSSVPSEVSIPPIATHVAVNCREDYRVAVRGNEEPSYSSAAPTEETASSTQLWWRMTTRLWMIMCAVAVGATLWVRRRRRRHKSSTTTAAAAAAGIDYYRIAARSEEETEDETAMVEMSRPTTTVAAAEDP